MVVGDGDVHRWWSGVSTSASAATA
jgi:hypothetical protein